MADNYEANVVRTEVDMSAQLLGLQSDDLLDAMYVARDVRLEEGFAAEGLRAIQTQFETQYGADYGSTIVYPGSGDNRSIIKEQKETELIEEVTGMPYEDFLNLRQAFSKGSATELEGEKYHEAMRNIATLYGREDEISDSVERKLLLSKLAGWISFLSTNGDMAQFDIKAFIEGATKDLDDKVAEKFEEAYHEAQLYEDDYPTDQDGNLPKLFVAGTVRSMLEKPYASSTDQGLVEITGGAEAVS